MIKDTSRPLLRPIETIVVVDPKLGRVLVLRDTQGIATQSACIPMPLVPIVARFTGTQTCGQIAQEVSREHGTVVPVDLVVDLANELANALFVEGPAYRAARARVEKEFAEKDVRPASHAGGAYHDDATQLAHYLDANCLGAAKPLAVPPGTILGLVAPHIDPWRGAVGYGHAYSALKNALPADTDTFVIFGTSHAPMRQPFALCRKAFATPLGTMEADTEAIDAIAKECLFDPYADLLNHKREHSLEFQAVFLRHLLQGRAAKIIPILAGLGDHQSRGTDPAPDRAVTKFFDAVRKVVERGKVVVIAGADMAHVGPRFGDDKPLDVEGRAELRKLDRVSLDLAVGRDAKLFWGDVARDLDTRRVCGLAPIYALLRTLPTRSTGRLLHYEQNVDPDEGSIVSHAALGFFG